MRAANQGAPGTQAPLAETGPSSLVFDAASERLEAQPQSRRLPGRDPLGWQVPFRDFMDSLHGSAAKQTQDFYRQRINALYQWAARAEEGEGIALEDFKPYHMRQFMAARADHINPLTNKPLSLSTRRSDAICAKVFFRFAHASGYIAANPLATFKVMKAEKVHIPVPTIEEGALLLRCIVDRWNPVVNPNAAYFSRERCAFFARRNFAIIAMLLQTGMRINEVFGLKITDYHPQKQTLIVAESKGNNWRPIPLEPALVDAVSDYLHIRPRFSPTDFLFVTDCGTQMNDHSFRHGWYKELEFAGLPRYSLHSLRHYSITCLAEVNKWAAQQIAGHKDGKVTDRYLQGNTTHLQKVMNEAQPLSRLLDVRKREKLTRPRLI